VLEASPSRAWALGAPAHTYGRRARSSIDYYLAYGDCSPNHA